MWVTITRDDRIGHERFRKGESRDVPDHMAEQLIAVGSARSESAAAAPVVNLPPTPMNNMLPRARRILKLPEAL